MIAPLLELMESSEVVPTYLSASPPGLAWSLSSADSQGRCCNLSALTEGEKARRRREPPIIPWLTLFTCGERQLPAVS